MTKRFFSALVMAGFLSTPIQAQSFVTESINAAIEAVQDGLDLIWPDDISLEDVNARVGFGMGITPDYIGSNNYRLRFIPLIDVRYKEAWRLNGSLLSFSAYKNNNLELGPLVNLRFGRQESRNSVLDGLGDIDTTLEIGAFVRYKTDIMHLSADYRYGLGENIRSSIRVSAAHGIFQKGNFSALLSGRARWLSKTSMQSEFGISEAQASTSTFGLPAFEAGAGISEVSANLVGAYRLNEKTRILSLISYGHLFSSAADSPLAASGAGSKSQFIVGTGLAYSF